MTLVPHDTGSFQHPDDPGEPTTGDPRLSITELEGQMLAALVAGRRVLEIGTGLGVSTAAMAATAEHVATYDIDAWVHDTIWPGLPDNVVGVKSLEHVGRAFGAVFIDADHSTEAVARDLSLALQHLGLGGFRATGSPRRIWPTPGAIYIAAAGTTARSRLARPRRWPRS